jgi:hypothetical protein
VASGVIDNTSWAETAIEEASQRAGAWYRALPRFRERVNLRSVVGFRHPALVSEQDCVIHFARFLNEVGVPWDAIHHQVSVSRWLFDGGHPAATAKGKSKWRVDLALLKSKDFEEAKLPAKEPGFQFDAFLEFGYLTDYWTEPGAQLFGAPRKGLAKVQKDVEKTGRYLAGEACRVGYVIVFEECDYGFESAFVADAEANNGCRVRFIRGYSSADGA